MNTPGSATPTATQVDAIQKRTLRVLFAAQILSGAGLAAGVTVGALLAEDMLGSTGLAGLPSALFTIGSAAAAAAVGQLSQRFGRRAGLAAGYTTGAIGSIGIVLAATAGNVWLLFVALFVYGAGTATNLQARYAGADLAHHDRRARAISTVLVATTVGAVVGPNLVGVLGNLADAIGVPRLAGPFLLAAVAYGAAGITLWILLRPDPLHIAAAIKNQPVPDNGDPPDIPTVMTSSWNRVVIAGAAVMMITQLVMVAIMTMTPVYMQHNDHDLAAAGLVISVHVAAMYLPSPVSGYLVDRFGSAKTAGLAAITLICAGTVAGFAPAHSVVALAGALALLGFGWSLGLIAGTTTVTDAAPIINRAKTQGTVDLFVAVAGAVGGLASGLIVAQTSFPTLAIIGAVTAATLVPILLLGRRRPETTRI